MVAPSAGILLVRQVAGVAEVLLVHPGGPFWAKKDDGAWSIPKGEYGPDEDPLAAARREFVEELGIECPDNALIDLGELKQPSGKRVRAWVGVGSIDTGSFVSNTFEMVWPPKSGHLARFPEVDRAGYFTLDVASTKILTGQQPFIQRAVRALAESGRIDDIS